MVCIIAAPPLSFADETIIAPWQPESRALVPLCQLSASAQAVPPHPVDCESQSKGISPMTIATRTAADLIATAQRFYAADPTIAREFTVFCKGESITFESIFLDDMARDLLYFIPGSFASSLYNARTLSDKQWAWVHKLAVDFAAQSAPQDTIKVSQFEALFNAFEAAKSKGAKRLTLRFSGINVKPNRDLTALWVTSQTEKEEGNYGLKPKYLGKVTRSGCDSRLTDDVKATIMSAASDPLTAAIRYGKVSGECSCCGRELTDPRSIERGIGPICAEKFGW